jgi:AbrB family looped-hinge helix DNA binding protein
MEKIEDVAKVSSKGQIVIPKEIREKMGISPGEKVIVMTRNEEIILKKTRKLSLEEISERIEKIARKEKVDIDKLIDEAIRWARSKQS